MSNSTSPSTLVLLLDRRALAALLKCSPRHVDRMRKGQLIPQPVKLGTLPRWSRQEIDAWIAGGCRPCSAE
jgi:predicted DNA-binding transcriptional regulator AlpA